MTKAEKRKKRIMELLDKIGLEKVEFNKQLYTGRDGDRIIGLLEQVKQRIENLSDQPSQNVKRVKIGKTEKAIIELLEDYERDMNYIISQLEEPYKNLAIAQAAVSRVVKTLIEKGYKEGKKLKLKK